MMLDNLARLRKGRTKRISSFNVDGRNGDSWRLNPGETKVLADIKGPGMITHIWMTQMHNYREVLLRFTWDNKDYPSILCPLGDFFCLGHGIVNSFQSMPFSASTRQNNQFNAGCALNSYVPMPFSENAKIELINESTDKNHMQYFYIDYETYDSEEDLKDLGYFHAEFHRENPFGGWGQDVRQNIANKERLAWNNNYVILETKGRGHYIGCNLSVTNFRGGWWGEGDDMIWVDGYKWPPDLHGTGSEDYLNQAWGMQKNAFLHNGSSIYEKDTEGYQTSYVFHIENPVRFEKEIKVTIEHGHANNLCNEMSSVAYWYAENPTKIQNPPMLEKRLPVMRNRINHKWIFDEKGQITTKKIELNEEMLEAKKQGKSRRPGMLL